MKISDQKNFQSLFCNFWTLTQISIDFQSLESISVFKAIGKGKKSTQQCLGSKCPKSLHCWLGSRPETAHGAHDRRVARGRAPAGHRT
jgi:hypothetical protein